MTTEIDFTKFRKGSKPHGRLIDYCPKCGRKGEKTVYRNGETLYAHKASLDFGFVTVKDSCSIKA